MNGWSNFSTRRWGCSGIRGSTDDGRKVPRLPNALGAGDGPLSPVPEGASAAERARHASLRTMFADASASEVHAQRRPRRTAFISGSALMAEPRDLNAITAKHENDLRATRGVHSRQKRPHASSSLSVADVSYLLERLQSLEAVLGDAAGFLRVLEMNTDSGERDKADLLHQIEAALTSTPASPTTPMIHPCRCGHEKGDHQQRLGQRGNYTPCCIAGCSCDGFRKAPASPSTRYPSDEQLNAWLSAMETGATADQRRAAWNDLRDFYSPTTETQE